MRQSDLVRTFWRGWHLWRTPIPTGGRHAWRITLGVGLFFIATSLFLPLPSNLQARVALTGIGAISAVFVIARPKFFWENGQVEGWRWFFGDIGVVIIYLAIGLGLIAAAWFAPL